MSAVSLTEQDQTGTIRVLHVDDEPDFADMVATFLEREDDRVTVETGTSASDGRDLLAAEEFDCVVSDYDMPDQNGIEFLQTVRETHPDLPFILFTGKGSEEIASEAISAGVNDYLQKGSGTDQYAVLANRISNLVEKYWAEREADRTRSWLEAITTNTNDAILAIDTDSTIRFANTAVADLFGYAADELTGESLTELIPPRLRDGHLDAMQRYVETGDRSLDWTAIEFPALHRDGHELTVSVSFSEFEDDGQRLFVGIIRDISERVRMEERLREREERFRQMAENIGEVVWMSDPEKEEMLYVNPAYEDIWGRSVGSLYEDPASFLDAVHPGDRDRVEEALDAQASGGYDEEYRLVRPDGELRWIHDRAVPVRNDAGDVYRVVGIASDVTDREESRRRLETLIDNLPGVVYRCQNEPAWPMEYVRGECESLTGYAAAAVEAGDVRWGEDVIHPDDRSDVWDAVQDAVARDEPFEVTYRITTKEGEVRWVWERGRGVSTHEGDRDALEGFITDVTAQKRHEQELQRVRDRMELALEFTDMLVWDWNVDTDEATFYPSEEGLYGHAVENWEEFVELVHPEDRRQVETAIERALETGEPKSEEVRIVVDGDVRWIEAPGKPVTDETGARRMVGIARDVTERVEREQRLEEERAFNAIALESVVDFYWVLDPDGYIVDWSDEDGSVTGYTPEEALGMHATEFFPEHEQEYIASKVAELRETGAVTAEADFHTKGGDDVPYRFDGTTLTDDDGEVSRMCGFGQDISARIERERELERQNEQLERFASVVSHDLRNPLNVAQGHLDLASEECESEHLDRVDRAHERMNRLIDDLLTVAREGDTASATEAVEMAAFVERCWENVETGDATVVTETTQTIQADRSRLQQLVENLVRNAVEHGGDGVTVTVGDLEDGFYVEDDGPGIPEAERADVFDVGYSTARDGSGFGLSIVAQVAEAHGWEVSVTDGSEGGARFEVTGVESGT